MDMNKICKICRKDFVWQDADLECFKKFGFEPLDQCSDCLHRQRLCFRNERVFYHRKCDAMGENIISIYHPDSPYKVYKADYFWSDRWDAHDYGQDFDFNRPFFEQFAELKLKVPRLAIHNIKAENSDYCNSSAGNKNSYMIFGGDYNESSMFGILCDKNKYCVDLDYCYRDELLYYCSDTANCYGDHYLFNSKVSSNCYFCEELSGCSECILSFNLRNKKFYIENKPYSEEEYFTRKKELINGSHKKYQELFTRFLNLRKNIPKKYAHIVNCQDCTGDYLVDSKNCTLCFDVNRSEDCRDVIYGSQIKDCFSCGLVGLGSELCYQTQSTAGTYHCLFCFLVVDNADLYYCDLCTNCHDCFGCVGMNHGEYCILNKQYSKEEYEEMLPRIVEHMKKGRAHSASAQDERGSGSASPSESELINKEWGQFFPAKMSCFGYNETTANLYFPLSKEEALQRGFNWRDEVEVNNIKQTYVIPDNVVDIGESILQEVLECSACGKNFRLTKTEFEWYKKQNVPMPRACMFCRLDQRASMRNPRKLWMRKCMKCGVDLQSSYSSDRTEKIYCEKCYLEMVY